MGTFQLDLKEGLDICNKFNTIYSIVHVASTRGFSKIEQMSKNLKHKHTSGLYCAKLGSETIYFQQKVDL